MAELVLALYITLIMIGIWNLFGIFVGTIIGKIAVSEDRAVVSLSYIIGTAGVFQIIGLLLFPFLFGVIDKLV
ncbi:MAG: hypothetical protein ACTSUW_05415 [Candidatus Heimdallarchaeota archaeon]